MRYDQIQNKNKNKIQKSCVPRQNRGRKMLGVEEVLKKTKHPKTPFKTIPTTEFSSPFCILWCSALFLVVECYALCEWLFLSLCVSFYYLLSPCVCLRDFALSPST